MTSPRFRVEHPARAIEACFPVAHVHVLDADSATGRRRVNELVIAKIDPDMGKRAIEGVKENQIAWLQILFVDRLAAPAHFVGGAGQIGAGFAENITNQPAAIQTLLGGIATIAIADADQ